MNNSTCSAPQDDEQNEKDPARRTNEKRGLEHDSTLDECSTDERKSQPVESNLTLMDFAASAPEPLDPEDLTSFAITEEPGQSFSKKALTSVAVRNPTKEPFIRTLDQEGGWQTFALLEFKEQRIFYLLAQLIAAALEAEGESTLIRARLVPTVDRQGNVFLWPLKVSGRECEWHNSAYRAAIIAKDKWIRVKANIAAGAYDTLVASSQGVAPLWPEEDFGTLLKIAFEGRVITQRDHPALKELRGE